ncbi:hypothetical protein [Catenulispora subtropica]|uniref:Uncharacterized protein n=1 Tax=Catenulispora subtropica TaxID=450798 RepID=A0ABN2R4R4_9ACTN
MMETVAGADGAERQAVVVLVEALERLSVRINRDLNVEVGEGAAPEDPRWAATLARFVDFADECLTVLDDPRVLTTLGAAV